MALISYDDFVANVQAGHLNLLASFTAGARIREPEANTAQINAIRQQCVDLYTNELLTRVAEGYERDASGVTWRTFDGYVAPVANGYVDRLARERLLLSRAPVPVAPEQPPP